MDEELRALERQALLGDGEAKTRLERARARRGGSPFELAELGADLDRALLELRRHLRKLATRDALSYSEGRDRATRIHQNLESVLEALQRGLAVAARLCYRRAARMRRWIPFRMNRIRTLTFDAEYAARKLMFASGAATEAWLVESESYRNDGANPTDIEAACTD